MIFMISSLIPFICLGFLSFFTIDSIIQNKVETSLQNNLKQDLMTLENTLDNLNHVSQQLSVGGGANRILEDLLLEKDGYRKIQLMKELKSELNLLSFSNPNIGLMMYYHANTGNYDFENFRVRSGFSPSELPVMAEFPEITYYGPHKSFNGSINQVVFSTMRKVNIPGRNIYLYIESGRNALEPLFAPENRKETSRRLVILDPQGRIAFSENQDVYPVNSQFSFDGKSGYYRSFFWTKETSNQGFSIVSITPQKELTKERNQWILQAAFIFVFFLAVASLFAWLLWKMVYHPLNKFNREITNLMNSDIELGEMTNIPEFDDHLKKVRNMKTKIWDLYAEIEKKEKRRADLEVEKLLYQINPHFLMNTLDTVHWLAVFSGNKQIDKLVLSLNKLLGYNLGKMGETTTVEKELAAVREYLSLQQVKYDFQYDIDADQAALNCRVPRFIMQPVVENSLYHGVSDNGYIHVNVRVAERLEITIQDNGTGMTHDEKNQILEELGNENQKVGMGIGLKYVKKILEAEHGNLAEFHIKSEKGKGTIVTISIPPEREAEAV